MGEQAYYICCENARFQEIYRGNKIKYHFYGNWILWRKLEFSSLVSGKIKYRPMLDF
jgi:hypothetical protein